MNILVTGAAGFIGSHLVERLLAEGNYVVGIDNFDDHYDPKIKYSNLSESLTHPQFCLLEADIRSGDDLDLAFKSNSFDLVFHLAAKAGVRPSIEHPDKYYSINLNGTRNLLKVMNDNECKNLIFASSSSVYGNTETLPYQETMNADRPLSPYAATKRAAELACYTYHHIYDFNISCLRFFTSYGPRQRPDMAISKFVDKILNREEIHLYGNGMSSRDYTYIVDVIDGLIHAAKNINGYNVYNIGSQESVKLVRLVNLIEATLKKKANIIYSDFQLGDSDHTLADISKARAEINYLPKTTLVEGLKQYCQWYAHKHSPSRFIVD